MGSHAQRQASRSGGQEWAGGGAGIKPCQMTNPPRLAPSESCRAEAAAPEQALDSGRMVRGCAPELQPHTGFSVTRGQALLSDPP